MSEPITPTEPDTEPDDEPTPDESTPDEPTEEDEDDEAKKAEQEAIARVKAASSAEIPKKIERAVTDQRKRLEKIIGVELEGSECPTCGGMGYTIGGADPDAALITPDNFEMCEACNGHGHWDAPTRNPDHKFPICTKCSGWGYVTVAAQPSNVAQLTPPPISAVQAQMGTMMPDGTFVPFGSTAPAAGQ